MIQGLNKYGPPALMLENHDHPRSVTGFGGGELDDHKLTWKEHYVSLINSDLNHQVV